MLTHLRDLPDFMLKNPDPPAFWLSDHRQLTAAEYERDTGEEKSYKTDEYGVHLTPATIPELQQYRNEARQILKDRRDEILEARQDVKDRHEMQKLKQESFGPDAQKVRIEYRGSTITLDSTDQKGIERILKIIKDA